MRRPVDSRVYLRETGIPLPCRTCGGRIEPGEVYAEHLDPVDPWKEHLACMWKREGRT